MTCKEGTLLMTSQIISILDHIDDGAYKQSLPIFSGSTLGHHFRHIIDFYTCLIRGVKKGLVDYSCRDRNTVLQTQTIAAQTALKMLLVQLDRLEESESIAVKADLSNNIHPIVQSSVGRELMFAYDHALHHLAIIKMGLISAFPNIPLPEQLGVSPSTLKHHQGGKATDG